MSTAYAIAPRTLTELASDIAADEYRVHDEARRAYTRLTGKHLPYPGDAVSWRSKRDATVHVGTVDEIRFDRYRGVFVARIEADRKPGEHKTTHTVDVDDLKPAAGGGR